MMYLVELRSKSNAGTDYFDAKFEEISNENKAGLCESEKVLLQLLFAAFSVKVNKIGLVYSGSISTPTQDRKKVVATL